MGKATVAKDADFYHKDEFTEARTGLRGRRSIDDG
jgi:hypothetical protein